MGWSVLACVNIAFNCKVNKALVEGIKKLAKKDGTSLYSFENDGCSVYFELSGNKYVEYGLLDKILKKFKKDIYSIHATEYTENEDGGYYYEKK